MRWDPSEYARYADERARPFHDLLARVAAQNPRRVVDLGCGSGVLTATLARRWPDAIIEGLDSSEEMIDRTRALASARLRFRLADLHSWQPPLDLDLLVSNATLQWVPDHRELLRVWAASLRPDAWLAFQVPANFSSPSHALMRELAATPRWRDRLAGVLRHGDAVGSPGHYAALLLGAGLRVDVWQTTYLHVLTGPDPVLHWVRGTSMRPLIEVLDDAESAEFTDAYAADLRKAYPPGPHGTILPFTRTFVVAHRPA